MTVPRVRLEGDGRQGRDLGPNVSAWHEAAIDGVAADLPSRPDDPPHWIVEPRRRSDDVQLLMLREPEPAIDQRVVERHRQGLDPVVEDGRTGECHRQPDQRPSLPLQVECTDHPRGRRVPRPDPDRVHFDHAPGNRDAERVVDLIVVVVGPVRRERVRNATHVVSIAQADRVREVVLDDPVAIVVVADVAGQEEGIPVAHHKLLAEVGRPPIDFHRQLVRSDDLGRVGIAWTGLREKRQISVRRRLVVGQSGVGQLAATPRDREYHERVCAGVVPLAGITLGCGRTGADAGQCS